MQRLQWRRARRSRRHARRRRLVQERRCRERRCPRRCRRRQRRRYSTPPQYSQAAPPPNMGSCRSTACRHNTRRRRLRSSPPRRQAAMTRSTRHSIRTRRGCRIRSAPAPPRPNRRRPLPIWAGGQPGAPLNLSVPQGAAGPCRRRHWSIRARPAPCKATRRRRRCHPNATPKDEYDLAYGYVVQKNYGAAAATFRDFLHKYPGDRLTPDAQYWLGESLFDDQKYHDAAEAFLAVSTKYGTSARRRTRCCGSANRSPPWARRRRPALRSARSCANIRTPRSA